MTTFTGTRPSSSPSFAWFAASRWYHQSLIASEFLELPDNVVSLPASELLLRNRLMHTSKDGLHADRAIAFVVLFAFGTGFRLICLAIIALEKYSSGGSYWNQTTDVSRRVAYVITSRLNSLHVGDDPDAAANHEDHVLNMLKTTTNEELQFFYRGSRAISASASWAERSSQIFISQRARHSKHSASAKLVTTDNQQQVATELSTVSVK